MPHVVCGTWKVNRLGIGTCDGAYLLLGLYIASRVCPNSLWYDEFDVGCTLCGGKLGLRGGPCLGPPLWANGLRDWDAVGIALGELWWS
jgi:hypothetical protein